MASALVSLTMAAFVALAANQVTAQKASDRPEMKADDGHHRTSTAIGHPGDPSRVQRTIAVEAKDSMRFSPSRIVVQRGETVRLVVTNSGHVRHEFVLDTPNNLREHAKLMNLHPDMEHSEPNHLTVDPGQSVEMVWQFSNAGTVHFGCLEPGHWDAGMKGTVVVN